jgi:multidrug transporter EmrE-like cation transporter
MVQASILCLFYALLNVTGAAIIKWHLKGKVLTSIGEWVNLFLNLQVIGAFALIFVSMLVIFKALSSADFTFVIPVSAGINFILTVIAGYYIFKDNLNFVSFIGFTLIISGIILLSINSAKHAAV